MINDVDVSRCDFLAKEDDYCSYSGEYRAYKGQCGCSDEEMCKDHPNCFYKKVLKQLKAKEQECDELKQALTEIKEIAEVHCVFCKKIDPETFDMSECKLCNHSKILQKISECEVEEWNH